MARQQAQQRRSNQAAQPSTTERIAEFIARSVRAAFTGQSRDFHLLLGVTGVLVVLGLTMVFSASYVDLIAAHDAWGASLGKQSLFVLLGVIGLTVASLIKVHWWERFVMPLWVFFTLLQFALIVIGKNVNGNKNWIALGPFSLQPSELLKIVLLLGLASLISQNRRDLDYSHTWIYALMRVAVPLLAIIVEKDLGTALIIMIAYIGVSALAGLPRKLLWGTLLTGAIGVWIILIATPGSTRLARINAWLHPNAPDPMDYNWQQDHGVWALAAGRLTGVGLGGSKMKWSWIPEVQNDFIFAIIGEELGLVFCLVVVALFVMMTVLLIRIATRTQDLFAKYFVFGVAIWISAQAAVNIAVVLDLLPVLGVPLPLISMGGTSMVAILGAIGIVLAVERDNHLGYEGGITPKRRGPVGAAAGTRRVRGR